MKNFLNKIIFGDCIEIMKQLPDKSVDLVLTDPPYELNLEGSCDMGKFCDRNLIKLRHIDFIAHGFDYDAVFNEFIRICKRVNIYIFCSNKQVAKIMNWFESRGYFVTLLVWHKTNAVPLVNNTYHSNAEFIVCIREQGAPFNNLSVAESTKVFAMPFPQTQTRFHPTEKPLRLIENLIKKKSNPKDIVLDCFSGSATTAIGCHNLDRQFICIEKDPEFYKKSVERLEHIQSQYKLFEGEIK